MREDTRRMVRLVLATLVLLSTAQLGYAYVSDEERQEVAAYEAQAADPLAEREAVTDRRQNMTVVAGLESNIRDTHALYAFSADGRLVYYDNSHSYGDVDPSPAGDRTVMTVRHDLRGTAECDGACARQEIIRVNLSTGSVETVWSEPMPASGVTRWHDVDRVGDSQSYLIADIDQDRVWRLNADTGNTEWGWHAAAAFDPETSGGPYPEDWTHLNDVERLPDGRIMLSLRNHDRVVFIHPETGLQPDWTLGSEDEWGTLFEQHNPDYIPEANGGPAVLVADSENNRVVEYQRRDGEWDQSWQWSAPGVSWPRDADRLPNGHTLITDSHGDRVLEINREGEIVWETSVRNPYEAERLGTGAESTGGPSAVAAGLASRGPDKPRGATGSFAGANAAEGTATKLWHGIQFVLPVWVGHAALAWLLIGVTAALSLISLELYWRGVRLRRPIARTGGEP